MKEVKLEEAAYQFEAKMSLRQAIPLGLQHVCAMFVGNLTPLLIITSACGIAGGEFADLQVTLLQSAMFVAGVVTLIVFLRRRAIREGKSTKGVLSQLAEKKELPGETPEEARESVEDILSKL